MKLKLYIVFFTYIKLIVSCRSCIILVRAGNNSIVYQGSIWLIDLYGPRGSKKAIKVNYSWRWSILPVFLQLLGEVSGYWVFYDKEFFLIQERKWYLLSSMFFNANMTFPPTFQNLPPNYSRSSPKSSQRVGRSATILHLWYLPPEIVGCDLLMLAKFWACCIENEWLTHEWINEINK